MLRRALGSSSRAYGECARRSIYAHSRSKDTMPRRRALSSSTANEADRERRSQAEYLRLISEQINIRFTKELMYDFIPGAGLGLKIAPQCKKGFKAGTTVLELPISFWGHVSAPAAVETMKQQSPDFFAALVDADAKRYGNGKFVDIVALATSLCIRAGEPEAVDNAYAAFIDTITHFAPPHPLTWKSLTLLKYYQGSPFLEVLRKKQDFFIDLHQCLFGNATINEATFLWSISRVLSRAISGKGKPFTFLPFFDLMNHSQQPNVEYEMHDVGQGKEEGLVVVKTRRMINPGEELRICYDNKMDNHKMLYTYGFVDPENPNPLTQRVPLSALLSESGPMWVIGGPPKEKENNFVLAVASAVKGANVKTMVEALAILKKASHETRLRALDVLRHYLLFRLRGYNTSLEGDQATLIHVKEKLAEEKETIVEWARLRDEAVREKKPFNLKWDPDLEMAFRETALSLRIEEMQQLADAMKTIELNRQEINKIRKAEEQQREKMRKPELL